jgi:hypothetical protein
MTLMRKAPEIRGFFFLTVSIIAGWVELIRQVAGGKIVFVLCGLRGFPQFWGLDSFSGIG